VEVEDLRREAVGGAVDVGRGLGSHVRCGARSTVDVDPIAVALDEAVARLLEEDAGHVRPSGVEGIG
jgi:hypothetical protein